MWDKAQTAGVRFVLTKDEFHVGHVQSVLANKTYQPAPDINLTSILLVKVIMATGTGGVHETGGVEFRSVVHLSANLLAQQIDRNFFPVFLKAPVGPAIAAGRAF
jgi:hypothetical protein